MIRALTCTLIVGAALAWRFITPPPPGDAKQEKEGGGPEVKLSRDVQKRIELIVEKPAKQTLAPEAVAYGVVIDRSTGDVDLSATETLRRDMHGQGAGSLTG